MCIQRVSKDERVTKNCLIPVITSLYPCIFTQNGKLNFQRLGTLVFFSAYTGHCLYRAELYKSSIFGKNGKLLNYLYN